MRSRPWSLLLVLLTACASAPAPQSMPRPHAFAPAPTSGPRIQLVSAPMEPAPERSWIGRADLDKARALLSQARRDIEPRQWEQLDRELTAAEQSFERFSRAASRSGRAAEVAPRCKPVPVPHLGGNDPHNTCADLMPGNSFPGWDVFVNDKNFDALQLATRTLWDVKTDDFGKHSSRSQDFLARVKLPELQREDRLAKQCGYNFIVGVKSAAHKAVLFKLDPSLNVVVMDWC